MVRDHAIGARGLRLRRAGDAARLQTRRYLVTLIEEGEFHSHAGFVATRVVGGRRASSYVDQEGSAYTAFRPTLSDFVLKMPLGAQVIYPKDLARCCMLADVVRVRASFETGVGSGVLSMTMLRAAAR